MLVDVVMVMVVRHRARMAAAPPHLQGAAQTQARRSKPAGEYAKHTLPAGAEQLGVVTTGGYAVTTISWCIPSA